MDPDAPSTDPESGRVDPLDDPLGSERGEGLLDNKFARAFLIFGLPAVTCLLVGSAIYVSRMRVFQDVHLLAQPEWIAGSNTAARVLAYDEHGRPLQQLEAQVFLVSESGESTKVGESGIAGLPALDVDIEVPDWPAGAYRLEARVTTPSGSETLDADVRLASELPESVLYLPPPPANAIRVTKMAHALGDVHVELLPHGPGLVPELANHLFLRTTDEEGRPLSTELGLAIDGGVLSDPLPSTVRTDELGLAVLALRPRSTEISIEVSLPEEEVPANPEAPGDIVPDAGPPATIPDAQPAANTPDAAPDAGLPPRSRKIMVPTTPAQMVLRLDQPTPEANVPFKVRVQSLHASRPLYVDAYRGSSWVAARTTRLQNRQGQLEVPGLAAGVSLLQSFTSTVQLGHAYSAHHVYLRGATETDEETLIAIAQELRRREIDVPYVDALLEQGLLAKTRRFELTAAFLLSRLDKGYHRPPLMMASRQIRSDELSEFQQRFKERISIAIVLLGLVVSVLLAYGFTQAAFKARHQRRLMDAEVGADEGEIYVTSMGRPAGLDRFRTIVQIALMVGVVAVGFILIALLVSVLNWHG